MTIKAFVHTTQLELKDVLGISLKRSHIYEIIAAAYGYSTYASLQADAILLSNTKWQVALDVSAIEARTVILGISIPELVAQKLATLLEQTGIISLRVREILRHRLNDDYFTRLYIKSNQHPPNSTTASRFSSSDHYAGELMSMFKQNEFNSPSVHQGLVQLSAFADRNASSFSDFELHQKLYRIASGFNGADINALVDTDKERYIYWYHHLKKAAMSFDMDAVFELASHGLDSSLYIGYMGGSKRSESIAIECETRGMVVNAYYWWIVSAINGSVDAIYKLVSDYDKEDSFRCWVWIFLAKELGFDLLTSTDTTTSYDMHSGDESYTFSLPGKILPALTPPDVDTSISNMAQQLAYKLYAQYLEDDIFFEEYAHNE